MKEKLNVGDEKSRAGVKTSCILGALCIFRGFIESFFV